MTIARAPPSRERVFDPDRAAGFAVRVPVSVRDSRVRLQPPRRVRRRSPQAQPAAAPYVNVPAQSEPTRRPGERCRAASESSILIAPPASPSVRRCPSAPCACSRSRRAECAFAPLKPSLLLLLTTPRRLNQSQHNDRESAIKQRASRRSWSRRRLGRACAGLRPRLARAAAAAAPSAPVLQRCPPDFRQVRRFSSFFSKSMQEDAARPLGVPWVNAEVFGPFLSIAYIGRATSIYATIHGSIYRSGYTYICNHPAQDPPRLHWIATRGTRCLSCYWCDRPPAP